MKDIIIYPSGDTNNTNPFIHFSGGSYIYYVIEMTNDGYLDLSIVETSSRPTPTNTPTPSITPTKFSFLK